MRLVTTASELRPADPGALESLLDAAAMSAVRSSVRRSVIASRAL